MDRTQVTYYLLLLLSTPLASAQPWPRHVIDNSSRGADGVRLADVNGDNRLDITTGWEEGGVIRVYTNPGPLGVRTPWPSVTVGRVRSPEDAVFVDLNGDGALDVVSSCEGKERTIYFHWSPPSRSQQLDAAAWTTTAVPATQGTMWMYATPAELDGRNGVDLVVGSKGDNATISWLESPADARHFEQWHLHPLRTAGWIMSLELHDMDRDGDPDILFSDRKGSARGVGWLENPGQAAVARHAAWPEHSIGGTQREVMFLAAGDVNLDRTLDVVAATSGGPLLIFHGGSKPDSWTNSEIPLPMGCGTGKGVAIGDVDQDGYPDLVFSCETAQSELSGVRWLGQPGRRPGAPWHDHEIAGPAGVKFDRLELLDLDEDGDLDVLTCEERDNLGVVWYENTK